ncbi:MAG: GDP-mannose 4,6-dehydratase [Myxococcota bacterium]
MSAPQSVLVTGAAGFVGSTLVDRLLGEGRRVVGLDNFDPFYPEPLKRANLARARDHTGFELVEGDIRDAAAIARAFEVAEPEVVVHLAALAGVRPSLERPADYSDVNLNGTTRLFAAGAERHRPRFVFASSSSVYGEREQGPFRESDPVERPISPYAATKRAGELIAHTFHHAYDMGVTCLRIFTAYGPRQRPDLAVRKFAERIRRGDTLPVYGDGSSLRDFTYVDDLVEGICRAIDRDLGFEILNFGAGRQVSVREMVETLERALGQKAQVDYQAPQTGDVRQTWADTSLAQARLGFRPEVPFETGVERFVRWLLEDGER